MEMHRVRYFLAVAQALNFTRAAGECHVAQPSLTRAIRQLEGELGGRGAVGYSKSNTSPILKLFLSRLDELVGLNQRR